MMKKILALGLAITMVLSTITTTNAQEYSETSKGNYTTVFNINNKNAIAEKAEKYDMPAEIEEYVKGIFAKCNTANVTVYSPNTSTPTAGGISTYKDSGSWSGERRYKGYTLNDWIVQVSNAFDMEKVNATGKFKKALAVYASSALVDKFVPFGSAGIALADFCFGNGTLKYAGSGDKVNIAPKYTSRTKFTYVKSGNTWVLGARTHWVKLQGITWYCYIKKLHLDTSKTSHYTNKEYYSPNYKSPDKVAISGMGIGGHLDEPYKWTIKNVTFTFE